MTAIRNARPRATMRRRSRGLSMVELMVGITVGLFVVAGSIAMMVENVRANRQNMLATRVNQDLRMAADLVARDLRRAGYWQNAASGLYDNFGNPPSVSNPHQGYSNGGSATLGTVGYSYAKNADNTLDAAEQFGFSVSSSGALQYQASSGTVRALTDTNVVTVTRFAITYTATPTDLYENCTCYIRGDCSATEFTSSTGPYNTAANRPRVYVRKFDIVLQGQSPANASIKREIRESIRVRNDELTGVCPTV